MTTTEPFQYYINVFYKNVFLVTVSGETPEDCKTASESYASVFGGGKNFRAVFATTNESILMSEFNED